VVVIRPRASHILLLILGLILSVAILAIVAPKLTHLAPTIKPPPAATTTTAPASASSAHTTSPVASVAHGGRHGGWLTFGHVLLLFALSALLGVIVFARWTTRVVRQRLDNRLTREYGLYEVRLSMHDEAREQDIVDMVLSAAEFGHAGAVLGGHRWVGYERRSK